MPTTHNKPTPSQRVHIIRDVFKSRRKFWSSIPAMARGCDIPVSKIYRWMTSAKKIPNYDSFKAAVYRLANTPGDIESLAQKWGKS